MSSLPAYAAKIPADLRVRYFCKSQCKSETYGEVSDANWHSVGHSSALSVVVTCGRCGGQQPDRSNWQPA